MRELSSPQEEIKSRRGIYIGESSRTLHERSSEHHKDAADFNIKSHMIKHWMLEHPQDDKCPSFTFSIRSIFKDALSRQTAEAIAIMASHDQLLNSKNEYVTNCISRVTVSESTFERKERERKEEETEKKEKEEIEQFKARKSGNTINNTQTKTTDNVEDQLEDIRRLPAARKSMKRRETATENLQTAKKQKLETTARNLPPGWKVEPEVEHDPTIPAGWKPVTNKDWKSSLNYERYKEHDRQRCLRRMETFGLDLIITDIEHLFTDTDKDDQDCNREEEETERKLSRLKRQNWKQERALADRHLIGWKNSDSWQRRIA